MERPSGEGLSRLEGLPPAFFVVVLTRGDFENCFVDLVGRYVSDGRPVVGGGPGGGTRALLQRGVREAQGEHQDSRHPPGTLVPVGNARLRVLKSSFERQGRVSAVIGGVP